MQIYWIYEFREQEDKVLMCLYTGKDHIDPVEMKLYGYRIKEIWPPTCVSYPDLGMYTVMVEDLKPTSPFFKQTGLLPPGISLNDQGLKVLTSEEHCELIRIRNAEQEK